MTVKVKENLLKQQGSTGDHALTVYQENLYLEWVDFQTHMKLGHKTTVCMLTLKNGFEIVGTSACINPEEYDYNLGHKYALVDALNKLDELSGFWRHQKHVEHAKGASEVPASAAGITLRTDADVAKLIEASMQKAIEAYVKQQAFAMNKLGRAPIIE